MTELITITSDARQRINKIINGSVFDGPLVCITELLQNAYRSKAKNVQISIKTDGTIIVIDDGVGCRTPNPILTLDYSQWESTDEGFGMGFWSVLALPMIETIRVASKTWIADIVVQQMLTSGTPQAQITRTETSFHGFVVIIKSPWVTENLQKVVDEIYEVGKYQPYNITLNGKPVPKVEFVVDGEFVKTFETRGFTAQIAISEHEYDHPVLYYENRKVCTIYDIDGVTGIIQVKPHTVNLKEPDRKSVVRNDKFDRFVGRVSICVKELYRAFLPVSTDEQLDRYADIIDNILSVSDYEQYIPVEGAITVFATTVAPMSASQQSRVTSVPGSVDADQFSEEDEEVESNVCDAPAKGQEASARVIRRQKSNVKAAIRKVSKKTWVRSSELGTDEISGLKAKAEYYGIKVWVAKNILHERVYIKNHVSHISDLKNGIVKRNIKKNVFLKTLKEEKFVRLLRPVCKKYNIPENTFLIGNIGLVVETRLGDKVIDKETLLVAGVKDADKIILDRKTLGLKRFNLRGDKIGLAEIRALMANVITISHELAHLKYGTEDNSVNHYKIQDRIHDEIVALYL